jgi:hypothetical protein
MNDSFFIKLTDIADVISGYAFDSKWFGQGKKKIVRITDLVDGNLALDNAVTFDVIIQTPLTKGSPGTENPARL